MQAIIGQKLGMTQVFQGGAQIDVTVIKAGPCVVVQRKSQANDGYEAVQLGYLDQKPSRATRSRIGHCKKANAAPQRVLREVRLDEGEQVQVGDQVTVEQLFAEGDYVDISGVTKGRGFQGVVRRHRMSGGKEAHGHTSHRRIGSIGQRESPARIFKNKRMPGHMGHRKITVQNLPVVQVRSAEHVILVRGAVPGPVGGLLMVRKSIKRKAVKAS